MSFRTTLILLSAAIMLGLAILGIERWLPSTRELAEMRRGPVRKESKKITQIEIEHPGASDHVSLQWDGGQWWVRQPFNDLADPERVTKLLSEIQATGWLQRVHRREFDDAAWERTLLDKPKHVIRLQEGGEQVLDLAVGAASPVEGSHYLAIRQAVGRGGAAAYAARTTLPEMLKATSAEWRDNKLLRLPAELVTGLKLAHAQGQIELARADGKSAWELVKPLRARGSAERINDILSTLLNLTVKSAAEPPPGTTATPSATLPGVSNGELRAQITLAGFVKPVELVLEKPDAAGEGVTKASVNLRKPVFTVLSKSLGDLWAEPNQLRDRMLARIDREAVSAIEITSALHLPIQMEKRDDSWFLKRHERWSAANGDRITRFFDALNSFQVLEFTSDSAANLSAYGLEAPFLSVSWTISGKKTSLLFGANPESTEFFAKYADEPSVLRVDASILPSIPQEGIKWKGLGVVRFSQFALRQISLSAGTAPPTVLRHDPGTAQWSGERAGQDLSALIDRVKADRLSDALSKLNAQDWVGDTTAAIPLLQDPALRIVVTLGEPGASTGPTRDLVLSFSPTQAGNMNAALFYGQLQGDADIFYIARSTLLELLAPVFRSAEK
ncbi:MAG: DUF4340 domain-containing protein [Prosthecobacter sp.]|nr:DUF4340 domain-containing protein [Prosthecobacter sp.]